MFRLIFSVLFCTLVIKAQLTSPQSSSTITINGTLIQTSSAHQLAFTSDCAAASASGTAYVCTTNPSFTPVAGDFLNFKADVANTGSATLSANGVVGTLKKQGGTTNLAGNDLAIGTWLPVTFDGTNWQILISTSGGGGGSGTVTSIAETVPAWLTVTGSPVTTSGTLAVAATTGQTSHLVIGTCGTATIFSPCALVAADLPAATSTNITGATTNFLSKFSSGNLVNSLASDSGTTLTYTGSGGINSTNGFASSGTTGGVFALTFGTVPSLVANSVNFIAPTSGTAYQFIPASAAASGAPVWTNNAGVVTETIVTVPWVNQGGATNIGSPTVNTISIWGIIIDHPVLSTKIQYNVGVADNTADLYDFGILDSTGTLFAHSGATAGTTVAASTGSHNLSWTATTFIPPGKYYFAITTSTITAPLQIQGATNVWSFNKTLSTGASTGGVLPSSVTTGADVWAYQTVPSLVIR